MFPKASFFLLGLLVAESQCAPAKIGGGFGVGASGEAGLTGGASVRGSLSDPMLLNVGATGLVGADTKGRLNGGAYGFLNNHVVGADGELKGNAAGVIKDNFNGVVGIDKNGQTQLGGTNRVSAGGEVGGGANGMIATNEDAMGLVRAYGGQSAQNELFKLY